MEQQTEATEAGKGPACMVSGPNRMGDEIPKLGQAHVLG